jgi:hypothetical protein
MAVACPLLESIDLSGARGVLVLVLIAASKNTFKLAESRNAMNTIRCYDGLNTPSVWRTNRTHAAAKVDALASNGMDEIEIPAFLRKQAD